LSYFLIEVFKIAIEVERVIGTQIDTPSRILGIHTSSAPSTKINHSCFACSRWSTIWRVERAFLSRKVVSLVDEKNTRFCSRLTVKVGIFSFGIQVDRLIGYFYNSNMLLLCRLNG
jgi:hypothetical protein